MAVDVGLQFVAILIAQQMQVNDLSLRVNNLWSVVIVSTCLFNDFTSGDKQERIRILWIF